VTLTLKKGIHPNNNSLMGILLLKAPESPPHLPFFSLSLLGLSLVVEYLSNYLHWVRLSERPKKKKKKRALVCLVVC
jgi:hypothetical protein